VKLYEKRSTKRNYREEMVSKEEAPPEPDIGYLIFYRH